MTERSCCEKKLDLVTVFANTDTEIAYELYQCSLCGSLYRASFWRDKGWHTILDFRALEDARIEHARALTVVEKERQVLISAYRAWARLIESKEEFKCPICGDPDFNCHHDEE